MEQRLVDKKDLTEQEIRTRYITPAIRDDAGWPLHQIREGVYLTDGQVHPRGKSAPRGKRKFADYVLYHHNQPLAIVEAKDNNHSIGAGMQQALEYAEMCDAPFAFSSNGDGFLEHDRLATAAPGDRVVIERGLPLDAFPSPDELWMRYTQRKALPPNVQAALNQPYHYERGGKTPRYYQKVAINRAVEAIAGGQDRVLLVMATGTGKTYVAFQIIWRLWKAGIKKRILFLADRNILVDQAKTNDFKPFGGAMTKVVKRQIDKSYEIYLALYQGLSGSEEWQDVYKQFSPGFFDLVVVDECHRGSAAADSAWREVLDYFESAAQIGMTATPKETEYVSNIDYFGEPIYTYSLRQGIEDGFLAPYKVIRVNLDIDVDGWQPEAGQRDQYGQIIPDQEYTARDFDRTLVIEERTKRVAHRVAEFLKATGRFQKTIVFCRDVEHAERMRQALVNENSDLVAQNRKYVMRITGDSPEGVLELDNFIDPAERYPVIATTSRLLTTGVDAQTCQLIVLDTVINSMTMFKQTIGRGSRIKEEYGKLYFTIMDFRNVTRLFYDPQFDGDPVQVYEPGEDDPITPPDEPSDDTEGEEKPTPGDEPRKRRSRDKLYVNGVEVHVLAERVQYYDVHGKLVTESFTAFSRENIRRAYATLEDFLTEWNEADRKSIILVELLRQGVLLDKLQEEVGQDFDPFDLICHVAYDRPALTRSERARQVKQQAYFDQYEEKARQVLEAMLEKYTNEGIEALERAADERKMTTFLQVLPFSQFGRPIEIVRAFGGKRPYLKAVRGLGRQIYAMAA
ncbi:MAG: EcoAI/FtnUII family type I restriction enzme subunit R [Terriglobia bacterium]